MNKLAIGLIFFSSLGHGATCGVTAIGPLFNYSAMNNNVTQQAGSVQVICTSLLAGEAVGYQIKFSAGSSNSYSNRMLNFAGQSLQYNLYKLPTCQQVLGDGLTGGTVMIADSYTASVGQNLQNYPIYGCIEPLQNVNAGSYSDSIAVTIEY